MEEIDIIELLQRVKEGKAPKKIQIGDWVYDLVDCDYGEKNYVRETSALCRIELTKDFQCFELLDTKIKILDKPVIEELKMLPLTSNENEIMIIDKINEIIRRLNNGLKTS